MAAMHCGLILVDVGCRDRKDELAISLGSASLCPTTNLVTFSEICRTDSGQPA
jgi:hypothetical protein